MYIPERNITGLTFGFSTEETIESISTGNLENYSKKRGQGSIVSDCLGPANATSRCKTCGSDFENCRGHSGHIDLFQPVINAFFFNALPKILSCLCLRCSRPLCDLSLLKKIKGGRNFKKRITEFVNLTARNRTCWFPDPKDETPTHILNPEEAEQKGYCGFPQPELWFKDEGIILRPAYLISDMEDYKFLPEITPEHLYNVLKNVAPEVCRAFGFHPIYAPLHSMMFAKLPVPPMIIRPSRTATSEDDLTFRLRQIHKVNLEANRSIVPNLTLGLLQPSNHVIKDIPLHQITNNNNIDSKTNEMDDLDELKTTIQIISESGDQKMVLEIIDTYLKNHPEQQYETLMKLITSTNTYQASMINNNNNDNHHHIDTKPIEEEEITNDIKKPPLKRKRVYEESSINGEIVTKQIKLNVPQSKHYQPKPHKYQKKLNNNKVPKKPKERQQTLAEKKQLARIQGPMSKIYKRRKIPVIPACLDSYFNLQRHIAGYMDPKFTQRLDVDFNNSNQRDRYALKSRFTGNSQTKGRVQQTLTGKRADKCGRSVISPGPYQNVDEVGVPLKILMTLTFKERVNAYNFKRLEKCVLNGRNVHPGANFIERNNELFAPDVNNGGLQIGDIVHRHLDAGDWVFINRQPTLHQHSILGLKIRISKNNTFEIHLSITTPLGADYDGDEINLMVPDDEQALAEIMHLINVSKNMLKDSKLLVGFVQHAALGAYKLTSTNDIVLTKNEVYQLLMQGNNDSLMDECLKKWPNNEHITGRQLVQMLLPTYNGETAVTKKILNQCMLRFIQTCTNSDLPIQLLSFLTRIFEHWCAQVGVSLNLNHCSIPLSDEVLYESGLRFRKACELSDQQELKRDPQIEEQIIQLLGGVRDLLGTHAVNHLKINKNDCGLLDIVYSGAKGDETHITQNTVIVGQQLNNYSQRNKETSPHVFNDSVSKYGFVRNGFYGSLTSLEFFMHLLSVRHGLIAGAINTGDIGYLYRKLFTLLENKRTCFDNSVRNAKGNIIMFAYGFDTSMLTVYEPRLHTLSVSELIDMFKVKSPYYNQYQQEEDDSILDELNRLLLLRHRILQLKEPSMTIALPVDLKLLAEILKNNQNNDNDNTPILYQDARIAINELWIRLVCDYHVPNDELQEGSFFELMSIYNLEKLGALKNLYNFTTILEYVFHKYSTAVCQTDTPVGYKAAQATGEPLTQKTLKSFHISGEKTTLVGGVTRLKEILNYKKDIATPSMDIYIQECFEDIFNPLTLVELHLDSVIDHWSDEPVVPLTWQEHFQMIDLTESDIDKYVVLTLYVKKNTLIPREVTPRALCGQLKAESKILGKDVHNVIFTYSDIEDDLWWITLTIPKESNIFNALTDPSAPKPLLALQLHHALKHEGVLLEGIEGIKDFCEEEKTIWQKDATRDYALTLKKRKIIRTIGSNLLDVCLLPEVDLRFTTTNDLHQVYNVFGIDAALKAIETNLYQIMLSSDATIPFKHISLIAHTMCSSGKPSALTFSGVASRRNPTSFFKLSTFERSLESFLGAAITGEANNLRGVAEALVVGTPISLGTGGDFQIISDPHLMPKCHVDNLLTASQNPVPVSVPNLSTFLNPISKDDIVEFTSPFQEKLHAVPISQQPFKTKKKLREEQFIIPKHFVPSEPIRKSYKSILDKSNLIQNNHDSFKPSSPKKLKTK